MQAEGWVFRLVSQINMDSFKFHMFNLMPNTNQTCSAPEEYCISALLQRQELGSFWCSGGDHRKENETSHPETPHRVLGPTSCRKPIRTDR